MEKNKQTTDIVKQESPRMLSPFSEMERMMEDFMKRPFSMLPMMWPWRPDGDNLSDWFQAETMVREYTSPAVGEGASRRKAAPKSNKKRKTK
jgi:hypothetical protein